MLTPKNGIYSFSLLCIGLLPAFTIAFLLASGYSSHQQPNNRKVYVKKEATGYALYKDGQPFLIKGASGHSNLAKLREVGGNTIRTYDTTHLGTLLDSAHALGLYVIVGIPLPNSRTDQSFYATASSVDNQYSAIQKLVETYKNHPALLIWCLGNELDITLNPMHYPFYRAYNKLLRMIKDTDPNHPVTTTLVNVQKRSLVAIRFLLPNLDFVSINAFGRANLIQQDLNDFEWFWDGPFLLTEWGIHGPWEGAFTAWSAPIENTSTQKARLHQQIFTKYLNFRNGRCLGTLVFYWGHKQEKTHTWFSLFSEEGAVSETVQTLSYLWTGKRPAPFSPKIYQIRIDQKTIQDTLLLPSDTEHTARIVTDRFKPSGSIVRWEILPEDRYSVYSVNTAKPAPIQGAIRTTTDSTAVFKTPSSEGPYRIFVEIIKKGNYATANFPFYVVQ